MVRPLGRRPFGATVITMTSIHIADHPEWIPDEDGIRRRGQKRSRSIDFDFEEEEWDPEPERKRQRPSYEEPERIVNEEPSEYSEARGGGAAAFVYSWRWTYSVLHGQTKPEFKQNPERIIREMRAFDPKSKFVFQLEDPSKTEDNLHYQGVINLSVKKRIGMLIHAFNQPDKFPGMQVSYASTAGKEALRTYCMKSDTRVAGPWGDRKIAPAYEGKDLPRVFWPWQKEVIDMCTNTEADDRTINYLIDFTGKQGKSKVCKYLAWKGIARRYGWGEQKNCFYAIQKQGPSKAYIFDLTRTKPKKICAADIYSMLEDIKNGLVDGSLYDNESILFDPPHVWVFANVPPQKEAMSADRFRVWTITADHRLAPYVDAPANMQGAAQALAAMAPSSGQLQWRRLVAAASSTSA